MFPKNVPIKCTKQLSQKNVPKKGVEKTFQKMSQKKSHFDGTFCLHIFSTHVPDILELANKTRKTCLPKTFQLALLLYLVVLACHVAKCN